MMSLDPPLYLMMLNKLLIQRLNFPKI